MLLHTHQGRVEPPWSIAHIRPEISTFVQITEGMRFPGGTISALDRYLQTGPFRSQEISIYSRAPVTPFSNESRAWRYTLVAYVRTPLTTRLKALVPKWVRVLFATSFAEINTLIRQYPIDTIFVDPGVEDGPVQEPLIQIMNEFPSIPLVAYTMVTPATFSTVHVLSKQGLHEVILFGYDDTRERITALFEDLPQRELVPLVMQELTFEIRRLPAVVQKRVREVLYSPKEYPSVDAMLRGTSYSRSSMYLIFREAGLGSPGHLLIGARLVHALACLRDPGHSVRQAAIKSGWQDTRILSKYLKRIWGMSPTQPHSGVTAQQLARQLVQWMRGAESSVKAPRIEH